MSATMQEKKLRPELLLQIFGVAFFAYLFFGFMLVPCLNTLTSIFREKNAAGEPDPFAVIRFFLALNCRNTAVFPIRWSRKRCRERGNSGGLRRA